MNERMLAVRLAQYMQIRYPEVIYRFDLAADLKLTMGQARRHKTLHPRRGYPDLFIAEMRQYTQGERWGGLYVELKAVSIYRKDGVTRLKDEHVDEQLAMGEVLEAKGYKFVIATGFDEARKIIDDYLGSLPQTAGRE